MEKILIVDDDADLRWNLSNILKDEGYETIAVGDGEKAIRVVRKNIPNLVLLDVKLSKMDGMEVLGEMKKINSDLIVIMITAYADVKKAVRAMKSGAFDYVTKPFDTEELILIIKKALHTGNLSREVKELKEKLGERSSAEIEKMMGGGMRISHVIKQVKIIALTRMTVILQGDSGTGKELIAQMIHQESSRKEKPFVPIDCGAIPEALVESELFGYEKGAFTGADARKEGKFEQANEGTLFLDEIGNLPNSTQAKLLRVIEERKLQHVGGRRSIKVDVRIVAATNTDLSRGVKTGKFRADLFHRLNEFFINLPRLKERKEDIPVLAGNSLREANSELGRKVKGFSKEAINILFDYEWPGNVRELKNTVRKAVLLAGSEYLVPDDLLPFLEYKSKAEIAAGGTSEISSGSMSFKSEIEKIEKGLIEKALKQTGGSKVKAADILGMNRKALYRKMKSLGM